MIQKIARKSLVVNDYDEAIKLYTEKLHFEVIEDIKLDGGLGPVGAIKKNSLNGAL